MQVEKGERPKERKRNALNTYMHILKVLLRQLLIRSWFSYLRGDGKALQPQFSKCRNLPPKKEFIQRVSANWHARHLK